MIDRGFRPDFEPEVESEVAAVRRTPDPTPSPGVRDLRSLLWSSIDEVESRDLDQIEVAEALSGDDTHVRVAIADVDSLVRAGSAAPFCARAKPWMSAGHWIPASTSIVEATGSSRPRRSRPRVSMRRPPSAKACPPIACRPPATHTGSPRPRAPRTASTSAPSDATGTTSRTRVGLSREWTSLTRTLRVIGAWDHGEGSSRASLVTLPAASH